MLRTLAITETILHATFTLLNNTQFLFHSAEINH